jgi:hypothetical protein
MHVFNGNIQLGENMLEGVGYPVERTYGTDICRFDWLSRTIIGNNGLDSDPCTA